MDPRLRLVGVPDGRRLFLTRSLPDEEKSFEVIDGRLEPKRRSVFDTVVGNELLRRLAEQSRQHGRVVFGMLFDLHGVDNFYRPEVAVIPFDRWPVAKPIPTGEAWPIAPALVVEVVGRFHAEDDLNRRTTDYFRGGVGRVWVVRTDAFEVHDFVSPALVRVLSASDVLTADPTVLGFRVPVAELFPPVEGVS